MNIPVTIQAAALTGLAAAIAEGAATSSHGMVLAAQCRNGRGQEVLPGGGSAEGPTGRVGYTINRAGVSSWEYGFRTPEGFTFQITCRRHSARAHQTEWKLLTSGGKILPPTANLTEFAQVFASVRAGADSYRHAHKLRSPLLDRLFSR